MHSQHHLCRFPPNSRSISKREMGDMSVEIYTFISLKGVAVITLPLPHLDGLYQGPKRQKSWHQTSGLVSWRWPSPGCPQALSFSCYPKGWDIYPRGGKSISRSAITNHLNTPSQVARVIVSTLPIVEKRPHRVSRCRVGEAVPYTQGEWRVRGRLGDGNLYKRSFT